VAQAGIPGQLLTVLGSRLSVRFAHLAGMTTSE
jgi:hypothetical protein